MKKIVKTKIKEKLPRLFAIIFYGLSWGDTHYVAVYTSISKNVFPKYENVSLTFVPLGDEDLHATENRYSFFEDFLLVYNCTINNVVALIWGNEKPYCSFARHIETRFIACHRRHFNLPPKKFFNEYLEITEKVYDLIHRLSYQIASVKLRVLPHQKQKIHSNKRQRCFL